MYAWISSQARTPVTVPGVYACGVLGVVINTWNFVSMFQSYMVVKISFLLVYHTTHFTGKTGLGTVVILFNVLIHAFLSDESLSTYFTKEILLMPLNMSFHLYVLYVRKVLHAFRTSFSPEILIMHCFTTYITFLTLCMEDMVIKNVMICVSFANFTNSFQSRLF